MPVATAILSGIFAAAVAIAVSSAIERLGGRLGGVLATLPTTVLPASLGLAQSVGLATAETAEEFQAACDALTIAMFSTPCAMLVNSAFLWSWRALPKRFPSSWPFKQRLAVMAGSSLSIWLVFALITLLVERAILASSAGVGGIKTLGVLAFCLQAGAGIAACMQPLDAPKGTRPIPFSMLLMRGGMAGCVILLAVLLGSLNSMIAGIVSFFPAIFLTLMVTLWISQGEANPAGAVAPMVLGGLAPPGYAMIFALTAPQMGAWGAAAVSWIVSVAALSVPTALFLRWRRSNAAAAAPASAAASAVSVPFEAEPSPPAGSGGGGSSLPDGSLALDSAAVSVAVSASGRHPGGGGGLSASGPAAVDEEGDVWASLRGGTESSGAVDTRPIAAGASGAPR